MGCSLYAQGHGKALWHMKANKVREVFRFDSERAKTRIVEDALEAWFRDGMESSARARLKAIQAIAAGSK